MDCPAADIYWRTHAEANLHCGLGLQHLCFRFFDITKFGPIGWADRRGDALGVMLDDVIAGVFAAIGVVSMAGLFHGCLMP